MGTYDDGATDFTYLQALLGAASPLPWTYSPVYGAKELIDTDPPNEELAVAAVNALPALLREREGLRRGELHSL